MELLRGKKTYIIACLMVLVSLMHLIAGEMSLADFLTSEHLNTLLEGIGFGVLRAGIRKAEVDL